MAFVGRGRGYDRAITVFSPDGKLFQVQYAQEAVKRGYTALGVRVNSGVVLAAERRRPSKLVEEESVEKIFQVDDHIGAGASGLIADARILIDRARIEAQVNRMRYDEPIPVETLSRSVGDIKQIYTQHAGVRPFGTRFLIGGVDANGPQLYETDPSGVVAAYRAHAIGGGASGAIEALEANYDEKTSLDDTVGIALGALQTVIEGKLTPDKVEMAIIPAETEEFEKISKDKVKEYIKKVGS